MRFFESHFKRVHDGKRLLIAFMGALLVFAMTPFVQNDFWPFAGGVIIFVIWEATAYEMLRENVHGLTKKGREIRCGSYLLVKGLRIDDDFTVVGNAVLALGTQAAKVARDHECDFECIDCTYGVEDDETAVTEVWLNMIFPDGTEQLIINDMNDEPEKLAPIHVNRLGEKL